MTILVAGANRVDAGKTTFAVGLVHASDGVGFKPRAGNDYWFDHDDYRQTITDGRVVGKDARRLASVGRGVESAESINPIHRLWRPAPRGDPFIGPSDRMFVLDRYGESEIVVNRNATIPESAREHLSLDDAIRVGSIDELNEVTKTRYLPLFEALADRIEQTETAVVESYGDVARPIQGITVDRVAVVEPGRVRIYEGDRYWQACEVATGSPHDGVLEERVSDVVDLLDPTDVHTLTPLSGAERSDPDRIARAYAEAYDSLT